MFYNDILVLEAFTFENKKISLKTFIKLTLFSMGELYPKGFTLGCWLVGFNNRPLFMNNRLLFTYCFLEIFVGGQSGEGGPTNPLLLGKTLPP